VTDQVPERESAGPLTAREHGDLWHNTGCAACKALDPLLIELNDIEHVDGAERDLIVRHMAPLLARLLDAERAARAPEGGHVMDYGESRETLTTSEVADRLDLPDRIVVGANGAYWRDYGAHYSMCPVSDDNDPVEPVAVYERAARAEPGLREALAAFFEDIDADWTNDNIRPGTFAFRFRAAADRLRAALEAHGEPLEHALHFDPDCEECAYLARPVVIHRKVAQSEAAWLIERGQPEKQMPTLWWVGDNRWTDDAFKAMRFESREAAEGVIASKFTPPPSRGGPSARAVEHGFIPAHGEPQEGER